MTGIMMEKRITSTESKESILSNANRIIETMTANMFPKEDVNWAFVYADKVTYTDGAPVIHVKHASPDAYKIQEYIEDRLMYEYSINAIVRTDW